MWVSKTRSDVSYPSSDNELCYQIEDTSFWFQHRNRCIANCVRAYPPRGVVFDVGGGNGFVSLGLQRAGWDTVVVEPGVTGASNAQRRGLLHVICSTFEDAGFRQNTLPAVGMFDVLEHVEDDTGFLRTLHEAMVPGGRLYLTVPAYQWLWSAEDTYAGHFRRYTLSSLTSTLNGAGFDVEFRSYMLSMLPAPIFLATEPPVFTGVQRGQLRSESAAKDHGRAGLGTGYSIAFLLGNRTPSTTAAPFLWGAVAWWWLNPDKSRLVRFMPPLTERTDSSDSLAQRCV